MSLGQVERSDIEIVQISIFIIELSTKKTFNDGVWRYEIYVL